MSKTIGLFGRVLYTVFINGGRAERPRLTHTEANFVATVDISSMPRQGVSEDNELTYPRFPLESRSDFVLPNNLDVTEKVPVSSLVVDEGMINNIAEATRDQSSSEQWMKERKFRFTASRFDLISKRQRSHEKCS